MQVPTIGDLCDLTPVVTAFTDRITDAICGTAQYGFPYLYFEGRPAGETRPYIFTDSAGFLPDLIYGVRVSDDKGNSVEVVVRFITFGGI